MTSKKITLELEGMDGNAFALLGAFNKQARREDWTEAERTEVLTEAQNGDYNHLLETLLAHTK